MFVSTVFPEYAFHETTTTRSSAGLRKRAGSVRLRPIYFQSVGVRSGSDSNDRMRRTLFGRVTSPTENRTRWLTGERITFAFRLRTIYINVLCTRENLVRLRRGRAYAKRENENQTNYSVVHNIISTRSKAIFDVSPRVVFCGMGCAQKRLRRVTMLSSNYNIDAIIFFFQ